MERRGLYQCPAKPGGGAAVLESIMDQTAAPSLVSLGQKRAFAQPSGQPLPREFLAMLVALDRAKQGR